MLLMIRRIVLNPEALRYVYIAAFSRQAQQLQAPSKRPNPAIFDWSIIVAQSVSHWTKIFDFRYGNNQRSPYCFDIVKSRPQSTQKALVSTSETLWKLRLGKMTAILPNLLQLGKIANNSRLGHTKLTLCSR